MMEQIILSLRNLGFYDTILPWIFAFALTYYFSGQIFKEKAKAVPPILGIVVASYLVAYTPFGTNIESFFTNMMGDYTMIAAGVLVFLMILAIVLGAPEKDETILDKLLDAMLPNEFMGLKIKNITKVLINLFFVGVAVYIFLIAANVRMPSQTMSLSPMTWGIILFLGIIAIALYFVTTSKPNGNPGENNQH